MKKTYKTADGAKFCADSATDLLTAIRCSSKFDAHLSNIEFMKVMADRRKTYNGDIIDITNPDTFIESLINTGYLQEEINPKC